MGAIRKMLGAAGVGAAFAYLFDPDRGRSRRARLREQAGAAVRRRRRDVTGTLTQAGDRLRGAAVRAGGGGVLHPEDDRDIVDGVRQALSGLDFPTTDVTVDVVDGKAVLRGQVRTPQQIDEVQKATSRVPGVVSVESWLHLPNTPAPNKAAAIRRS